MLASIVSRLRSAVCSGSDAALDLVPFADGDAGHVRDGALVCRRCSSWFPIQNGVLELVEPGLLDSEALRQFEDRFAGRLASAIPACSAKDARAWDDTPQMKRRRHFDRFGSNQALN